MNTAQIHRSIYPNSKDPRAARFAPTRYVEVRNLKVLVVEDEPADSRLIQQVLGQLEGFNVLITFAADLAAARAAAEKEEFDVALVDFFVNGECGLDLVPQLVSRCEKCAPILLTGQLTQSVHLHALEAGVVASLSKDRLEPRLLEATIRHALQNRSQVAGLLARLDELNQVRNQKVDFATEFSTVVARYLGQMESYTAGMEYSLSAGGDRSRLAPHVNALHNLVGDLKSYCQDTASELERRRRADENVRSIDLQAVLIEAIRLVDERRKRRGIGICLGAMDRPVHVRANKATLLRALVDLLSACLAHMAANGQLDLKVATEGSEVRLGISSSHFMSRPDDTRLGGALHIAKCRAILDRYQGELEILSAPNGKRHIAVLRLPSARSLLSCKVTTAPSQHMFT